MNWTSAHTLCSDLRHGTVSAVELMAETYARIEAINPEVNALVALLPREEALRLAQEADRVPTAERGPLHGLPFATKDAVDVAGFASTWGFAPWADNIASQDDGLASRLRQAGVIFIGRSNMPEFGLGSNTFNSLYGATFNPYDLSKTCGGSSGGAAVALATGMLPLADGSDMGGSLRNPASFCNVVGFRPSMGRMPFVRGFGWFGRLATTGPMARTVADATLLFSVQAGPDIADPLALPEPGAHFLDALTPLDNLSGKRVAYAPRLHGLPIAPEVMSVMDQAADVLASLGADVTHGGPNLEEAMSVFQVQRAAGLAALGANLERTVPDWRAHAKDTAIWNIEKGQQLTGAEIIQSESMRSRIYTRVAQFFTEHDVLVLPAAQVPPFSQDQEWVTEIDGQRLDSYIDWMTICCAITITDCPAISVPAGFTAAGLPIGVQLVGKPRGDFELLRIAQAFESATQFYQSKPAVCAD